MNPTFSPYAWETVREMHKAGCALDLSYLQRRYAPVQVFAPPGELEFFAAEANQFLFQLRLQLVAHSSVTITRLEMEAAWLPGKVDWAKKCRDHECYCLHPHFQRYPDDMLPAWLRFHRYRLQPGVCIEGLLAGRCHAPLPRLSAGEPLEAILLVSDGRGYRHEFPLRL